MRGISLEDALQEQRAKGWRPYAGPLLEGERFVLRPGERGFPPALEQIPHPPEALYGVGDPGALQEGLAVVGARRATPYGRACTQKFAGHAAARGIVVVSGGARGCDSAAHRAALDAGGTTVAVLGGGIDQVYPAQNHKLFQRIVDGGGAVVSEHDWAFPALPYTFRERNRLIAGLAKATLIVEAALPSGTFSTADEALVAGKDVLVVPGAITSPTSAGSNQLLYQGAQPVADIDGFDALLCDVFGLLRQERVGEAVGPYDHLSGLAEGERDLVLEALAAEPMRLDDLLARVGPQLGVDDAYTFVNVRLADLQRSKLVCRFPDGRFGPCKA